MSQEKDQLDHALESVCDEETFLQFLLTLPERSRASVVKATPVRRMAQTPVGGRPCEIERFESHGGPVGVGFVNGVTGPSDSKPVCQKSCSRQSSTSSVDFSPHEMAAPELSLQAETETRRFARRLARGLKSTLR